MTSDERVLQYVADANPVPDPQTLDLRPFESADLTTTRRRRAMRTRDENGLRGVPDASRRRPRWAIAVAAAVATLVMGGAAFGLRALLGGDGEVADGGAGPMPALGVAIPIGEMPQAVAASDEAVFVVVDDGAVVRFDPGTGTVTGRIEGLDWLNEIIVHDGDLWVGGDDIHHIDSDRMELLATIRGLAGPLVSGHGSVWGSVVTDHTADDQTDYPAGPAEGATVVRLDPGTNEIITTIPLPSAVPEGSGGTGGVAALAVTHDAVWVATGCDGCRDYVTIQRIDPATNQVTRVVTWQLGPQSQAGVAQLVVVDGQVWLVSMVMIEDDELGGIVEGRVLRVTDGEEPELLAEIGQMPAGAAYAGGSVWVTDCPNATLTRLDPESGKVDGAPLRIGIPATGESDWFYGEDFSCPGPMAIRGGTLWIVVSGDGTLLPVYLDPAAAPGPTVTIPPPSEMPENPTTTNPPGPETTYAETTGGDSAPDEVPTQEEEFLEGHAQLVMRYAEVEAAIEAFVLPPDAEPCEPDDPGACDPESPAGQLAALQREGATIFEEVMALLDDMDQAGIAYPVECSAAGADLDLPAQPGLPEAVAATRRVIFDAAVACDWEILAGLIGTEATAEWRRGEMLPSAPAPMIALAETLTAPWGAAEDEDGTITAYVWPSAVVAEGWEEIPPEEQAELLRIYGDDIIEGWFGEMGFFDWRLWIDPDGRWEAFVAGT
jgi:hypothetical protein